MAWVETTLGEVLPFKYGKNLPAGKRSHSGEFDVVTSAGVVDSHSKPFVNQPSIVIGRKGTIGSLTYCADPCWPSDTTFYTTGSDFFDLRFGYYFLQTLPLTAMNNDSAVPGLNRGEAEALPVRIPNLSKQKHISSILGSLDDKIAANHSAVESAERLIDAVICEKASTTKAVTIAEELVLHYGKSLPASKRVPGGIPVVGSGGVGGWHSSSLVGEPTIVVGRKGTIGALHWIDGPSFPIDTTFWVESKRLPIRFIYSLLKLVDFSGANTDSAVPGLNRSVAYEKSLPFISDEAVSELLPEVSTLDALCSQLRRETKSLANTRDELLPLLMSGKITVKEAGQEAVAAGAHIPSQDGEA